MTISTLGQPAVADPKLDDGDHEKFAHYVLDDDILKSQWTGDPIVALCGKVWVPNRDPEKFPICPECQELYDMGPAGRKEFWARREAGE